MPNAMTHADVVIIGGGLAGAACAYFISKRGARAVLLERMPGFGLKVCSEFVPSVADEISVVAGRFVRTHIRAIKIYCDFDVVAHRVFPSNAGYVINRAALSQWLAAEASRNGATTLTNTPVRAVKGQRVVTDRDIFDSDYVVFADGTGTIARHHFDFSEYQSFFALQYRLILQRSRNPDEMGVYVFSQDVGFGWCVPTGEKELYLGVTASDPKVCKPLLAQLRAAAGLERSYIEELRGAPVPTGGVVSAIADANSGYALCGDAAGQYLPLLGEGNRLSLVAAQLVAAAIGESDLDKYTRAFEPYRLMIEQHRTLLSMLRRSTPELRRHVINDFAVAIISRWLLSPS